MITRIENIEEEKRDIYIHGIVKNIEIRKRKSDEQELAYFDIESINGYDAIKCHCYTEVYKKYKHLIKENRKVLINGNCILKLNWNTEPIEYFVFIMKNGIAV